MKVAIISCTNDETNGWGNITNEYCKSLFESKALDFVLYLPKSCKNNGRKINYKISYSLPEHSLNFKNPIVVFKYFFPKKIAEKFDLLHILFGFPLPIYGMRLAAKMQIPYILGTQGTYGVVPFKFKNKIVPWMLRRAYINSEAIIVPSDYTASMLRKHAKLPYNKEIKILHNGVNYKRFQKEVSLYDIKSQFGNGKVILSVGHLKERKGQDIMLRAFKIVKKFIPDAKYILIGEDLWNGYLRKLVNKLNLRDVFFLPPQKGDNLVRFFRFCDVYAHVPRVTNIYDFEGFGIVYLEAGACGKPVVASKSGGIPSAVINGVTGLLVPENNPEATAKALIKILSDKKLSSILGNNGRLYAKLHSWTLYVEQMLKIYKSVID